MTPQLVDHAHTDSCIVIGCNLVQPRRKINKLFSGRSHIAVASQSQSQLWTRNCTMMHGVAQLSQLQSHHSHCEQRLSNVLLFCFLLGQLKHIPSVLPYLASMHYTVKAHCGWLEMVQCSVSVGCECCIVYRCNLPLAHVSRLLLSGFYSAAGGDSQLLLIQPTLYQTLCYFTEWSI